MAGAAADPVIPLHRENDEYVVFDPAGWYEDGTYHALIGTRPPPPATRATAPACSPRPT